VPSKCHRIFPPLLHPNVPRSERKVTPDTINYKDISFLEQSNVILPLVPVMDVHGQEASSQEYPKDGAGDQHRVNCDIHLRMFDKAKCTVFRWIPAIVQPQILIIVI
jgi:hypothetical protein